MLWHSKLFAHSHRRCASRRFRRFEEITKSQARQSRSLTRAEEETGGRNNNGRLTSRHIGGGHKQKYRIVDFKRRKRGVARARSSAIEYDPNRTARIALLKYADGEKSYILAPVGLAVGAKVTAGENAAPELGNALPLERDSARRKHSQYRTDRPDAADRSRAAPVSRPR